MVNGILFHINELLEDVTVREVNGCICEVCLVSRMFMPWVNVKRADK